MQHNARTSARATDLAFFYFMFNFGVLEMPSLHQLRQRLHKHKQHKHSRMRE
jgi:hypothetical protein